MTDTLSVPLEGRAKTIIKAATGVFARYGFARTTMADLAQAAGLSRTALYPFFANKAEVFDAVVRAHAAAGVAVVRGSLAAQLTLETQLRFACEHLIVAGFEFVRAMPDARDLFDPELPAMRDVYAAINDLLVEIIAPFAQGAGIDVAAVVRASISACRSFKEIAVDADDLRGLIATQVDLIVHRIAKA